MYRATPLVIFKGVTGNMIHIIKLRRIGVTVLSYDNQKLRIQGPQSVVLFFTMSVSVNKLTCWWCAAVGFTQTTFFRQSISV